MNDESARTAEAYGASRRFVAFRTLRTSSVAAVSLVGVDVPVQLGTAFFLENVFHLHGLGEVTWRAIATSDVTWLMTVGLVSAMVVAVMQILGDVVLSELNPQIRSILLGKRGVFR
jgi:peptide/nickel transport system permease protein